MLDKVPEMIPRGVSWSKNTIFKRSDYCLFFGKVLARAHNGEVAKKLIFNDDLSNLSANFCDELNHEFLELFQSTICLGGSASLDLRSDEDVAKEYIVQEELRLRIEEKERVRLKEKNMMEEDNRVRLETEKMLRLEEDKRMQNEKDYTKREEALMNSDQMKKAKERIAPAKYSQVSGDALLYYWGKIYRMAKKKKPCYGLNEPDMMELIKDVRPWVEDLSRRYSDMNTVYLSDAFDLFFGKPGPLIYKFPWCNDHIELWVNYMWNVRYDKADWAMVSSYFVQLLLQKTLPLWYANGERYIIPWCDVNQVQLLDVLEQARVFEKKGINPSTYSITFCNANNVPKQGGSLVIVVYGMTSQDLELTRCGDLVMPYSDYLVFDVLYDSYFMVYPLRYTGPIFQMRISRNERLSYSQILFLAEYYVKNMCCDENDDEVTSLLRTHEKKDYFSMSFKELVVWQEEEANSPFYLRSSSIKPKIDLRQDKGKALFDDFEDVANDVVAGDFDDVAKNNICGSSSSNNML
uniref:Phospholipase-like protein n=1 Tax=Tanacetum cinerariifolium TaxID=118510 RepID=A0A6L2NRN7_TANCI|nr:phospholipase-like protein [Tanacetum cinerariifolium]